MCSDYDNNTFMSVYSLKIKYRYYLTPVYTSANYINMNVVKHTIVHPINFDAIIWMHAEITLCHNLYTPFHFYLSI